MLTLPQKCQIGCMEIPELYDQKTLFFVSNFFFAVNFFWCFLLFAGMLVCSANFQNSIVPKPFFCFSMIATGNCFLRVKR